MDWNYDPGNASTTRQRVALILFLSLALLRHASLFLHIFIRLCTGLCIPYLLLPFTY